MFLDSPSLVGPFIDAWKRQLPSWDQFWGSCTIWWATNWRGAVWTASVELKKLWTHTKNMQTITNFSAILKWFKWYSLKKHYPDSSDFSHFNRNKESTFPTELPEARLRRLRQGKDAAVTEGWKNLEDQDLSQRNSPKPCAVSHFSGVFVIIWVMIVLVTSIFVKYTSLFWKDCPTQPPSSTMSSEVL